MQQKRKLFRKGEQENSQYHHLFVPKDQIKALVEQQHEDIGHLGKSKTYWHMIYIFHLPRMQRVIRHIVAACDNCIHCHEQHTKCDCCLKEVEYCLNNVIHEGTSRSRRA